MHPSQTASSINGPTPMELVRPQGLLLDAMGTLIGLREPVGATYSRLAAEFGIVVGAKAVQHAFGKAWRNAPPLAFPGVGGAALRQVEIEWWGALIRTCLEDAAGQSASQELVLALFQHYARAAAWQVYADVPPQLEQWRTQGLKLAVVSNFDTRLLDLLEELGLARWFSAVVVSSTAGAAKPDPKPFRQALTALELAPSQVWHVGDSREDAAGAAAAGLACVLVRRP